MRRTPNTVQRSPHVGRIYHWPITNHRRTRSVRSLFAGVVTVTAAALLLPGAALGDKGATSSAGTPVIVPDTFEATDRSSTRAPAASFAALRAAASRDGGTVRAIVGLQMKFTPEGALSTPDRDAQRAAIARKGDELLAALDGTTFDVIHRYRYIPFVALKLSTAAVARLEDSGLAASALVDKSYPVMLADSGPIVEARESDAVDRSGRGQHIAILDTGVQKDHLFLAQSNGSPKVVSEACYSSLASCAGGASTAVGSGEPCTLGGCDHGTHVAGIAAGRGSSYSGVARDANLISIQVFSSCLGIPCAWSSDIIAGLSQVNALSAAMSIASVNMSLGGGLYTANCDAVDPAMTAIITTLRANDIATVIASGNASDNTGVSFPSCISDAITVGSTEKTDVVSSFSNSSSLVELLAPGGQIESSIPDSTVPKEDTGPKSGTSMAAPHVAGAWALMKSIRPGTDVPTVLSALQSTGKPITDPDNSVDRPRIRVLSAGTRLAGTGLRVGISTTATGADMVSGGVGLRGTYAGSITQSGIPAGATPLSTKVIWTTLGGPDDAIVFDGVARTGSLAGASKDSCWNINQLGPNRTYYATLPVALGNGTYTISGVGSAGVAEAQGASLQTTYRKATGGVGRIYQRIGAATSIGNATKATVTTEGSGIHLRSPAVHVAVGDGQGFTDEPLQYGTPAVAITSPDIFGGWAGRYWDDYRVPISPGLIPAGALETDIGLKGVSDCLVLSAAAVSYETQ
jgi:subtilisin